MTNLDNSGGNNANPKIPSHLIIITNLNSTSYKHNGLLKIIGDESILFPDRQMTFDGELNEEKKANSAILASHAEEIFPQINGMTVKYQRTMHYARMDPQCKIAIEVSEYRLKR